jgi:hypothetical protein
VTDVNPERSTIYTHEETLGGVYVDTVQRRGWRALNSNSITVGKGYRSFFKESNINSSRIWDVTGGVSVGPVSIPLSKTNYTCSEPLLARCSPIDQGWNLVANPLPSSIDWSTITAPNRLNINNAFYRWEGTQYRCYLPGAETFATGIVASGAGPIIPSSQGFFVYVLGTAPQVGTLTINESNKVSGAGTFYRTNVVKENQLGIGISGQGFEDVAGIWFKPEATTGFDENMEAHKMTSPVLNISTPTSDGLDMVYNSLPMFTEGTIVPLHVTSAVQGTFVLSFGDVNTFAAGTEVYLKDNYLGQIIALEDLIQYSFEINGDAASQGTDRFEIVFSSQTVTSASPVSGKW